MKVHEKEQIVNDKPILWEATGKDNQKFTPKWPKECVYELSEIERDEVRALCQALPTPKMKDLDNLSLWEEISLLSDELPRLLRYFLCQFETQSNQWGSIIIRNLPMDDIFVPTPETDARFANYNFGIFAKALSLISARLGYPRAYRDEKNQLVMQPVYPKPGDENKQENSSSKTFLEDHTEDGFLNEYCDFLLLGCMRPDQDGIARTGVSCSWQAVKLIEWKLVEMLLKPLYWVDPPSSFTGEGQQSGLYSRPVPVLSGDPRYRPTMIYDRDAMHSKDPNDSVAKLALQQFGDALNKVHYSEVLLSSDCLIVDNKTSVHTRSSFNPRFDEYDRWLLRLKVFSNPRACAANRLADSLTSGSIVYDLATMH